ncbi:MAG: hypothetical protein ACFFEY_15795 [Candidatus Thorarchaeota archaeon]
MIQANHNLDEIKKISISNCKVLESIIDTIKLKINGRREIMYSDIINLMNKKEYMGQSYSQLILWCNYKIRLGKIYVESE